MSAWDWMYEFTNQAEANGDRERARLLPIRREAFQVRDQSPDASLALLEQGRLLAQRLDEPWWITFFDHWRLQALIYRKQDTAAALDLAIHCAVETRKPNYQQFPQRVCLHEDLIWAYIFTDAEGVLQCTKCIPRTCRRPRPGAEDPRPSTGRVI